MMNLVEVRQCQFVTFEYYWHNVSGNEFYIDGIEPDFANRIRFLIPNTAFL